ncbi:coiled-coil domain-containing protein 25 [Trichoderma asperellum]|uniref:Coiled-coil domain-containing protein 25 n=1 Tax=Trichoderma asperellum TaxID=101201 RepID=A0A6V8QJF7_TRIAP|nr:coiled-coil domain-containing protein 25 [Trichoderma asperellum]
MVYYFTSNVVEPAGFIYVGKDKFENEDLIKYGWEEDLTVPISRFHVDKLSSAHIYLRMQPGQSWDDLPQELVMDLAQLTKANSIEGNKKDNITVIYTPWSNLKKDGSMDVGQVKRILVPNRENPIVNRLNKTKVEKKPDLKAEKDEMLKQLRAKEQAALQIKRKEEQRQAQEWKEKKWQKDHAYDELFTEENMAASSNQDRSADWEDDFM